MLFYLALKCHLSLKKNCLFDLQAELKQCWYCKLKEKVLVQDTLTIFLVNTFISVVHRHDAPRDQDVDLQSQNYMLIQIVVIGQHIGY